MPRTTKKAAKEPRFEEALAGLERIVQDLEGGDLPLDDALKLFEEGVRLSRLCSSKLDEAEKRIEILMKGADGEWRPEPFHGGEEDEEETGGAGHREEE
jgi:exodeoxyribonuclease VII small subunit